MKISRLSLGGFLLLALAGCALHQAIVAIPEANLRSEVKLDDRLHLPLDPAARGKIEAYLTAGGNRDNIDRSGKVINVSDPDAKDRLKGLLDLLSEPNHPTVEDLTEKQTYKKWFHGKLVYGVIDAREEAAPPLSPMAALEGKYWWVFYRHGHDLTGLMVVVRPIPAPQKREKY